MGSTEQRAHHVSLQEHIELLLCQLLLREKFSYRATAGRVFLVLNVRSASADAWSSGWCVRVKGSREAAALRHGFQEFVCVFPRQDDSVNYRVETGAVATLDPQKVPRSGIVRSFAVVAGNVDNPGQFGRYRLEGNAGRHGVPGGHHAFLGFGRLFAHGTARIVCGQLAETIPVNGVSAGHLVAGRAARKEVFLTNRTVGLVLAHLAIVVVVQGPIDAHATIVTVLKVLGTTHPTKSTIRTMVGTLLIRHPQIAYAAMIGSKLYTAVDTVVAVNFTKKKKKEGTV